MLLLFAPFQKALHQCCESGMIYSGSGYDFLEFQVYLEINKKKYGVPVSYQSKRRIYRLSAIFYLTRKKKYFERCTVLHSRIHRQKIGNTILIYLLFHSNRIRIRNKNSGSDRIRIHNTAFHAFKLQAIPLFWIQKIPRNCSHCSRPNQCSGSVRVNIFFGRIRIQP